MTVELWERLGEFGALVLVLSTACWQLWKRVLKLSKALCDQNNANREELKEINDTHSAEIKELNAEHVKMLKKNSGEMLKAFASGQGSKPSDMDFPPDSDLSQRRSRQ